MKHKRLIAAVLLTSVALANSACMKKQNQPKTKELHWEFKKTNQSWENKLSTTKLQIVSSYGDTQAFHPKVLNFSKPWNGYRYWMAYTPYPGADQRRENPHIRVSNDKITWKPVTKTDQALDPVVPFEHPDKQYNSDTHLVYRKDLNVLECYWRQVDNIRRIDRIFKRTTTDGKNWSDRQLVLESDARIDGILSPSILYEDGKYKMWTVNYVGEYPILYRESTDGFHWSTPREIYFQYPSERLRSWHLDVIHTENGYEVLVVAFYRGHRHRDMNLYYTSSKDNQNYAPCTAILKPSGNKSAWDNRGIYRSSFFIEDGSYYVYYSGIGYPIGPKSSQGVGLTYGPSIDRLKGYDK